MAHKPPRHRHIDIPARTRSHERTFLYAIMALFVSGFIILSSASIAISYKEHGSIAFYTLRQLMLGGILGGLSF